MLPDASERMLPNGSIGFQTRNARMRTDASDGCFRMLPNGCFRTDPSVFKQGMRGCERMLPTDASGCFRTDASERIHRFSNKECEDANGCFRRMLPDASERMLPNGSIGFQT